MAGCPAVIPRPWGPATGWRPRLGVDTCRSSLQEAVTAATGEPPFCHLCAGSGGRRACGQGRGGLPAAGSCHMQTTVARSPLGGDRWHGAVQSRGMPTFPDKLSTAAQGHAARGHPGRVEPASRGPQARWPLCTVALRNPGPSASPQRKIKS